MPLGRGAVHISRPAAGASSTASPVPGVPPSTADVTVLDVVLVDGGRYRSLLCHEVGCCPAEGEEIGDLRTTESAAGMVLRGRGLVEDESALVADVTHDPWPADVPLVAERADGS